MAELIGVLLLLLGLLFLMRFIAGKTFRLPGTRRKGRGFPGAAVLALIGVAQIAELDFLDLLGTQSVVLVVVLMAMLAFATGYSPKLELVVGWAGAFLVGFNLVATEQFGVLALLIVALIAAVWFYGLGRMAAPAS